MPGPALTTEAIVLSRRPPTDAWQNHQVFTAANGTLRVLQRVPKKPSATTVVLDLFDEVALTLEGADSGSGWFVKEARILTRHTGIGRGYESLRHASAFVSLVARNQVPEESRAPVYQLLRTALAAFATTDRPDIVYWKSLYCLARDEGYPLKQHWFAALPAADRTDVVALLNRPVAEQTLPSATVARLLGRLEDYLRGHTEILVD